MSNRRLYDRVTGTEKSIAEKTCLADARYLIKRKLSGTSSHAADVVEDVLLHDGSDTRAIDGWEIQLHRAADFAEDGDPFEVEFQALLAIDDNTDFQQQVWPNPLLPAEIGQQGDPSELERLLAQVFERGHLDTIAARPRLNIRYDAERLPIDRAKRLDPAFLRDLAAHSECWASRTLSGVIPKTILAQISEDELDIYEHRVFARLLDHLERYLRRRIRTLEKISKSFAKALDFENAEDVDYRLRNDICAVWGEAVAASDMDTSGLLKKNHTRLEHLRRWERHLRRLKSGDLYRTIPHNASVGLNLRSTNLLQHDPHYRQLRLLWRTWLQDTANERLRPEKILEKRQKEQACYERYIGVLIYRSLKELGFSNYCSDSDGNGHAEHKEWDEKLEISHQQHAWYVQKKDYCIVLVPAAIQIDKGNCSQWLTYERNNESICIPCVLQFEKLEETIDPLTRLCKGHSPLHLSPLNLYTQEVLICILSKWLWTQRARKLLKNGIEQDKKQLDRLARCPDCKKTVTPDPNENGFYAYCRNCKCEWGIKDSSYYYRNEKVNEPTFEKLGRRWLG